MPGATAQAVLQVSALEVTYGSAQDPVHAVRGLEFELFPGEVVAVVGESGSGKTQAAMALMGLLGAGARRGGSMVLQGDALHELDEKDWTAVRGKRIGLVSQDPAQALNPYLTIGAQMLELLQIHRSLHGEWARAEAGEMLRSVGLTDWSRLLEQYPHELSGGMQQRVVLALALLGQPAVLVADEPTTALDVTTQAQVLALIRSLATKTGTAVLLISHDLAVVRGVADRVLVMYGGRIMEQGASTERFDAPGHPYTAGLLACVPRLNSVPGTLLPSLWGQAPGAGDWPAGCPFHPRCPQCLPRCKLEMPPLERVSAGHLRACFNPDVTP